MSSSDSSDDEEEAKKISQAIIPNDFLESLSSATATIPSLGLGNIKEVKTNHEDMKHSNGESKKRENNSDNIFMKSRRPDKNKEDDDSPHGYFLKTTPEFRAHVEKHLTKILDRELDANLHKSVWKKSNVKGQIEEKGIKLFSNVKVLCLGETASLNVQDSDIPKNRPKIQPRKHRLRSSSESSEDEEDKIMSCVFTVDDIEHENHMLENLSKSGLVEVSNEDSKSLLPVSTDNRGPSSLKRKKKRKTIDADAKSERLQSGNASESNVETVPQNNKKKKKKSCLKDVCPQDEASRVLTCDDFDDSLCSNRKKKKKISAAEDGVQVNISNGGNDCNSQHVSNGKKKKKKKKSVIVEAVS